MSKNLTVVTAELFKGKKPEELPDMPQLGNAWMQTLRDITGVSAEQAKLKWNAEKMAFMKMLQNNYALRNCNAFSIWGALSEGAASGLSFSNGECHIIPFGQQAVWVPDYKGRMEQIQRKKDVDYVYDPQVVYKSEVEKGNFDFEAGEKPRIIKHKPNIIPIEGDKIVLAYVIIKRANGELVTYIINETQLQQSRKKSPSLKAWYQALAGEHTKLDNGNIIAVLVGRNGKYEKELEPPLWVSDEPTAWKKTVIKYAYKMMPKSDNEKAIDNRLKERLGADDIEAEDVEYLNVRGEEDNNVPRETFQDKFQEANYTKEDAARDEEYEQEHGDNDDTF